jgi:hypothetical protein
VADLGVPCGPGSGRMVDARRGVGALNADFTFESVRIAEEDAENGPQVGHEIVGGLPGDQSRSNRLEGFEGGCMNCQVVEAASPAHAESDDPPLYCPRSGTR